MLYSMIFCHFCESLDRHKENEAPRRARTSLDDMFRPDRDKDAPAFLTREGQAQLASGQKICKWEDRFKLFSRFRCLIGGGAK